MNDAPNQSALTEPSNELRVVSNDTRALVMDKGSMDSMMRIAELMASSKVTIPSHLRGSTGDCMAVVMQAMQWGMNPFSIAQKTHLSQGGALGYEAQLINAVLVASGAVQEEPEFEFLGDWSKILGKVEERKSDKGGKYYVPTYNKADEDGLGVICTATMRSGIKRSITVMMSQCYPRFSTQWATDPQQQITYVAVRKLARRYAPGAILGVYTPEELEESHPQREIDITPTPKGKSDQKPELPECTEEVFNENKVKWKKMIEDGLHGQGQILNGPFAMISTRAVISEKQRKEIASWAIATKPSQESEKPDEFIQALDAAGSYTPE